MIKKYIKKNIEVEAIQYNKNKIGELLDFCDKVQYNPNNNEYYIETLEGKMQISDRAYIIKGIKGEFYPCDKDIFEASYQETDNFIDLNKLKNYTCFTKGASLKEQVEKVFEETKKFKAETNGFYIDSTNIISEKELLENRDNIIAETLDCITAKVNLLHMLNATKEDFDRHIAKLDRYVEIGKYGK